MSRAAEQVVKLEFHYREFLENARRFLAETREEAEKVILTGASAYATSAQQHTPPSLGQKNISPIYYMDGFFQTAADSIKAQGRRPVYRLRDVIRDPRCKNRALYGKMLRQGYEYMVKIFRKNQPVTWEFCQTEADAARYAHETYRGLTRAAWGLGFASVTGSVPSAFAKYLAERPELARLSNLSTVKIDKENFSFEVINHVIPASAGYMGTTNTNAQIAALRSMNDRMNKFFAKKREL